MSQVDIPRAYLKFFENAYNKKRNFNESCDSVEIIAFGNSQGDGCFDTRALPKYFNACTRSQDLKYSFLMYEKLGSCLPNLKKIILFYSFISPGFLLEDNRGEQGMALALNAYFDLQATFDDIYLESAAEDLQGASTANFREFEGVRGFFPNAYRTYFDEPYWESRRALDLLAFNAKTDALPYLERFVQLAKERGHELYFVIPPNNPVFTDKVGRDSVDLHQHLYQAMRAHGLDEARCLLDLYHAQDVVGNDFADYNHIVPDSAATRLITQKIVQMVESGT